MRNLILAGVSALALTTGAAMAQQATRDTATTPNATAQQGGAAGGIVPTAQAPAADETPQTTTASSSMESAKPAGASVAASDLIDRNVIGADGETIGEVSDLVFDVSTGKISQVVIASGGFLGLGQKTVSVDFSDLNIEPGMGIVAKSIGQADIEGLPEYDVSTATESLDATGPATVPPTAAPAAPAK